MKPSFLTSLLLIICMVFSIGATAFLHLNEHHLDITHSEHYHTDSGEHHEHDLSAEHAHHFNLHVTADLVEHSALLFTKTARVADWDFASRLISRSYTPPIPPPNA